MNIEATAKTINNVIMLTKDTKSCNCVAIEVRTLYGSCDKITQKMNLILVHKFYMYFSSSN